MIKQPTIHRRTSVATAVGILSVLYASTFLVGALLHLGWRIPLGFTVLAEPKILPATVVEGLCGLALAAAAIAVFTSMRWAWTAAFAAHSFSFGGVLLGMGALAVGAGPSTELNAIYLPPSHAGYALGDHGTAAFSHWEDRTPSGRVTDSNTITLNTWTSSRGLRSRV